MEHTQQFIEDAVAGGCGEALQSLTFLNTAAELGLVLNRVKALLLTPQAWQAVGKTRGWTCHYRQQWNDFIDHLADGKTIEEALAAIAN